MMTAIVMNKIATMTVAMMTMTMLMITMTIKLTTTMTTMITTKATATTITMNIKIAITTILRIGFVTNKLVCNMMHAYLKAPAER